MNWSQAGGLESRDAALLCVTAKLRARPRAPQQENTIGNRPLHKGAQSGDRFAHD
jgi:hypothetical protein